MIFLQLFYLVDHHCCHGYDDSKKVAVIKDNGDHVSGSSSHQHGGDDDLQYRHCQQLGRRKGQNYLVENDDVVETVDY